MFVCSLTLEFGFDSGFVSPVALVCSRYIQSMTPHAYILDLKVASNLFHKEIALPPIPSIFFSYFRISSTLSFARHHLLNVNRLRDNKLSENIASHG